MRHNRILRSAAIFVLLWPMVLRAQTGVTLTTLVSFDGANGSYPIAGLILGNDGNLYGTTTAGGANGGANGYGFGTVFRMNLNGTLTTLASFDGINGNSPMGGLAQDNNGNFYGTTAYGGTYSPVFGSGAGNLFELTTNGILTSLISFDNTNGAIPTGSLKLGIDGSFYGTTGIGGTNIDWKGYGLGTLFQLTPDG